MKTYSHILVSGSLAYDRIMDFDGYFKEHILPDKIHSLNVSFYAEKFRQSYGGTAGNIAYSLALLGEKPIIMCNAGHDFGKYRSWLLAHHINLQQVTIYNTESTAFAYIITDQDDNQISAFCPGAMVRPARRIPQGLLGEKAIGLIAPGNLNDMLTYAGQYRRTKTKYFFDPGQQTTILNSNQFKHCLKGAFGFISNDYELSLVLKKTGWTFTRLLQTVPIVVTTLGAKGSKVFAGGKKIIIPPAKPKNTSDPTGAGDAYRAGFIKGLQSGLPLEKCGRLGAVVSVYSVETYGTQTHHFTWRDIKKRYRQNFKEDI